MKRKNIQIIANTSITAVEHATLVDVNKFGIEGSNFVGALVTGEDIRIPFHEAILCTQVRKIYILI